MAPDNETPTLPPAFGPLEEERARIERILDRLDVAEDLTERADLASELVRSTSRYEDTLERAVWPTVAESEVLPLKELEEDRHALREAMTAIYDATKHVDARNVHAPDPEGFEDALDVVRQRVRAILTKEDSEFAVIDAALVGGDERDQFSIALAQAMHNASEKPVPPKTALGRLVTNAAVKLDNNFEDASTPQHPAAETTAPDAPTP